MGKKAENFSGIDKSDHSKAILSSIPDNEDIPRPVKRTGLVENYLKELDWKIKENSNMSYSLQGLNSYISSEISA